MKKILVIGATVLDIVLNIDHLPKTSEDIHIKNQKMTLGGCAYNAANILDKFEVPYTLLSPIGTGRYADIVKSLLKEKQMTSAIELDGEDNGFCLCMVEKEGERTFVVYHGIEYSFNKEWVSKEDLLDYDSVYISGLEIEEKNGIDIIEFVEENPRLQVYFAPGPRVSKISIDKLKRILCKNPIIHLNEEEIIALCNRVYDKECCVEYRVAAERMNQMTHNTVIVTLGNKGAYYVENGCGTLVTGKDTQVIDTIGAGDSHIGSIMATQQLGYKMEESIQCANKVAAAVVGVSGASLTDKQFHQALDSQQ